MALEQKARLVKDGHKTPILEWSTFAGVVSRESVRIAFKYAALNGLQFVLLTSRMLISNPLLQRIIILSVVHNSASKTLRK